MPVCETDYPKDRGAFFAYRLTRLMFKAALANDIGPEACYLIAQIAMTEDATRYKKPVTFYNDQLMPVCGFSNVKSLDRARAKAVKSGWLVYIPGGKGKAGKYWTQFPEQYSYLTDGPIDESNVSSELSTPTGDTTCLPVAGKETGDKRETNGREEPDKRETNGRQTGDKWATILPIPSPVPIPEEREENNSPPFQDLIGCSISVISIWDHDADAFLEYPSDPIRWQHLFIAQWNKLDGVANHSSARLSTPEEKNLLLRFRERDWDWTQAFLRFPINYENMPLSKFLAEGMAQNLIAGEYRIQQWMKDKAAGIKKPAIDVQAGVKEVWNQRSEHESQMSEFGPVFNCSGDDELCVPAADAG